MYLLFLAVLKPNVKADVLLLQGLRTHFGTGQAAPHRQTFTDWLQTVTSQETQTAFSVSTEEIWRGLGEARVEGNIKGNTRQWRQAAAAPSATGRNKMQGLGVVRTQWLGGVAWSCSSDTRGWRTDHLVLGPPGLGGRVP